MPAIEYREHDFGVPYKRFIDLEVGDILYFINLENLSTERKKVMAIDVKNTSDNFSHNRHIVEYTVDGDVDAHGDEEYLYVIDCDERTIKCYEVYYDASFNDLGKEVKIPDNIDFNKLESEFKVDDECVSLDFDTYWESYMKIVNALIICGENIEEIPELALKTLKKCMKFVYKN